MAPVIIEKKYEKILETIDKNIGLPKYFPRQRLFQTL